MSYLQPFIVAMATFLFMDIIFRRMDITSKLSNKLIKEKNFKITIIISMVLFAVVMEFGIDLSNQIFSGRNYISLIFRGLDIFIIKELFAILSEKRFRRF
ncbi:hypothetical protein [Clostridium sp. YIM B02506]|uniref:hypothetical protein n=1 Tax=Clostridium sp. YIM B02506 TaxID=2910680 RepID=UPI001EEF0684|nr:hypothetical protein [Clostridium sp. YIM B02506]